MNSAAGTLARDPVHGGYPLPDAALLTGWLLLLGAGCGSKAHPPEPDSGPGPCHDPDGDGWGEGAGCLGADCLPADPGVHECDCGPDGRAEREGCPCDGAETILCFEGPAESQGVGTCEPGLRWCSRRWGPCEGQVLPVAETCDGTDEDCDGVLDDGVTLACGDCDPTCTVIAWGPGETPFDPEDGRSVVVTPEGHLTIREPAIHPDRYAWIPNTLEGTISKIDTSTYLEIARYRTGPLGPSVGLWSGDGDNPSRTAVDWNGDAYVANRAFTGTASITKLLVQDCPADPDGQVRTSTGGDDVLPWGEDQCVAWNTEVGNAGDIGQALALQVRAGLDGQLDEVVWAGRFSPGIYHELDGESGEPTGVEVDVSPCTPHAATVDPWGNIWSTCLSSQIHRFRGDDPGDAEIIAFDGSSYALALDWDGNLWVTGDGIARYRVEDRAWDVIETDAATSGIVADFDGNVWSYGTGGALVRIYADDPDLPFEVLYTGRGGPGITIDGRGFLWAINWAWGPESDGDVTLIDPDDFRDTSQVCCEYLSNSLALSNMVRPWVHPEPPIGMWEVIVPGCDGGPASWKRLDFTVQPIDGTAVSFRARTADDVEDLPGVPAVDLAVTPGDTPPIDLASLVAPSQFLQLEVFLQSADRERLPVVERVAVQRSCQP